MTTLDCVERIPKWIRIIDECHHTVNRVPTTDTDLPELEVAMPGVTRLSVVRLCSHINSVNFLVAVDFEFLVRFMTGGEP